MCHVDHCFSLWWRGSRSGLGWAGLGAEEGRGVHILSIMAVSLLPHICSGHLLSTSGNTPILMLASHLFLLVWLCDVTSFYWCGRCCIISSGSFWLFSFTICCSVHHSLYISHHLCLLSLSFSFSMFASPCFLSFIWNIKINERNLHFF